ncbi:hypothetical protein ACJRO7_027759 [Eucalyptus globulus]|uniref:Uncharacterized protein n=1 Tax=Eucalyptus globulus TaxID=34317 RepID=A0ABD3JXE0_EUCGL
MGVVLLKIKISLLLILLLPASLFTCHAGRPFKSLDKWAKELDASERADQEEAWKATTSSSAEKELAETNIIYERLLRANAKDYGRSDPAPAVARPQHKPIPN